MAQIRIRVGASLDASAATVFQPLEKAAQRARANIDKSLNEAAKATTKVAKASKTSGDAMIREVEAMGEKLYRDEEKAQEGRTKVVGRETKERVRLEKQALTDIQRITDASGRVRDARGRFVGGGGGGGVGGSGGGPGGRGLRFGGLTAATMLARGGASMALGAAESLLQGIGVDMSLASHMANAVDLQQRLTDVANAGYIPGAAGAQGRLQDKGAIGADVRSAANAGAFGYNEAAEGLQKFVGLTGDLETGRSILKSTAELARATGADFVKMSEASAEVANHMGSVPDKGAKVAAVMRVVAGQGKLGALEIKDFARQMAKIAANAPMFEGSIDKTIGELGLIAQESKMGGGSASASQAATSVLAFASDFSKKTTFKHWQDALDSHGKGLNPFTDDKHTTLRSPEELILEAVKYSKGDQIKLAQLFPSRMAQRAVKPFTSIYAETKGTDAQKLAAVVAEFDRMRAAQLDAQTVQMALSDSMATTKSKVQLANNKLDDMAREVSNAMLPAIAGIVPALEAMTPALVSLTTAFAGALGGLTQATSLDEQKAALRAQNDALRFRGTLRAFERSNMEPTTGGRSDMLADVSLQRAQPILDAEAKKEDELRASIASYESTVASEGKTFAGKSDKEIKEYAAGGGLFGRLEPEASKYMADRQTLDGLKDSLTDMQTDRTNLLDAITSGRMRVTVVNLPAAPGKSGAGAPSSGVAPAESE